MVNLIKTHYKGQKIHTRYDLREKITKLGVKPQDLELFYPACEIFPKEKKYFLFLKQFTITMAVDWCIKNDYENVYLAGVDMDKVEWQHFYDAECYHISDMAGLKRNAQNFKELEKHINIFQLNPRPNDILKLPHFKIENLI